MKTHFCVIDRHRLHQEYSAVPGALGASQGETGGIPQDNSAERSENAERQRCERNVSDSSPGAVKGIRTRFPYRCCCPYRTKECFE
jgi:hypothetical protein